MEAELCERSEIKGGHASLAAERCVSATVGFGSLRGKPNWLTADRCSAGSNRKKTGKSLVLRDISTSADSANASASGLDARMVTTADVSSV
jgi:hypothetical protein